MGLTVLEVEVGNPARPATTEKVDFLIDSGAIYSVVPREMLDRLGIRPLARQEFRLADGSKISRDKGGALFRYRGLALHPLRRELRPLPMILAGMPRPQPR